MSDLLITSPTTSQVIAASEGRCPVCGEPADRYTPNLLRCSTAKCDAKGKLLKFVDGQFHYDPILSDDDIPTSVDPKAPWPADTKLEAEKQLVKDNADLIKESEKRAEPAGKAPAKSTAKKSTAKKSTKSK